MESTAMELISKLAAQGKRLDAPGAREDVIKQAFSLIAALETPMENLLRMEWVEPSRYVAVRLAIDLGIFETLAAEFGKAKTVTELSAPKSADPVLVARIVRHLAATGVIAEAGNGTYTSNNLSKALAAPEYSVGVKICFDTSAYVYTSMPSYFEKNGYKNPNEAMDGPWQHAHGPGHAFAWFNQKPERMNDLNIYLFAQRNERPSWTEYYPIRERLVEGMDTAGDRSALVDVGGGAGLALEEVRTRIPEWKGRLVLQEQELAVKHAEAMGLNSKIEAVVYDFFTPQPVKGARAYSLRNILHDWPDNKCREILVQLKDAMEPGYSKILLNEVVVGDNDPAAQHTALDLQMMAMAAGVERTKSQWTDLLGEVGLRIDRIWSKGYGNESIIEVVK